MDLEITICRERICKDTMGSHSVASSRYQPQTTGDPVNVRIHRKSRFFTGKKYDARSSFRTNPLDREKSFHGLGRGHGTYVQNITPVSHVNVPQKVMDALCLCGTQACNSYNSSQLRNRYAQNLLPVVEIRLNITCSMWSSRARSLALTDSLPLPMSRLRR